MNSKCIIFNGYKDKNGYGILSNGKRAHRVAYENTYGKFNNSLFVCHKCDNPSCVNPKHLFLRTNQDNVDDKMKKGRHKNGPKYGDWHPRRKLSYKIVDEIKRQYIPYKVTQVFLSKKYRVSQAVISNVIRGVTWQKQSKL